MIKEEIKKLLKQESLEIDIPENSENGDYSTNVAFKLAKAEKKNPSEIAERIAKAIHSPLFFKVEAKNGFVNFFVSKEYLQKQVKDILKKKNKYGDSKIGKNKKINVEFISANPTGPLTLGNGRGGFCGDVLSNVLEKAGYKVGREYYINDRGLQVIKLGHSVLNDDEAVYKGEYIKKIREKLGNKLSPEKMGEKASKIILETMIKPSVGKMGIKFDKWFSEKFLYSSKEVDKALNILKKKGLTYEKEDAVWFKTTEFKDDKDRVLVKKSESETYLASDVAYLLNKFKRGFKKLVFFWGADHHGYIGRIKASAEAMGFDKNNVDFVIMQLVRLFEDGKEKRMSKRSGIYVTIDELIDEVGLDAARFFFLMRSPETHLNFDMNLAKEQSNKNPVYYVQYAHARICSILKNSKFTTQNLFEIRNSKLEILTHENELALLKKLIMFPEIVEEVVNDYGVERLAQYAIEIADAFHRFYEKCRVICDDKETTECRLALITATKIVLKNTLDLMGISSPEKM